MAPSFVQSASSTAISGATVTVTLGSPTTAGNCLVIASGVSQAAANPTITGVTLGGAADHMAQLVTVGTALTTTAIAEIWADPNCAGGQTSVVVTYSVTPPNTACVFVYEFSGIATSSPLDQSSTAFTTSSQATFDSGATPTTTQASELWFGADSGFSTTTTGPSSPWINSAVITSGNRNLIAGYQIVSSTGTADYSGTYSPNSFENAAVVTLKSAAGTAHTATAALTVTPALAATRVHAAVRAAALTVTPALAATRTRATFRTAALTVTPALHDTRVHAAVRSPALTVTPVLHATATGGRAPAVAGNQRAAGRTPVKKWMMYSDL